MMNFADLRKIIPAAKGAHANAMSSARNGSALVEEFARKAAHHNIDMRNHARRITARILPFLFLAVAPALQAQTAASLSPEPNLQFLDTSSGIGLPCVNCTLKTYAAGTTTPLKTYTDSTGTTQNPTTITLNSRGYTTSGIWLGGSCYKYLLADAQGATIWTVDHICDNAQLIKAGLAASTGAGLVGFSQSASYPAGTLGKHDQGTVLVTDAPYNATGDGTTNDTTAVQAAITATQGTGKTLVFPAGTYAVCTLSATGPAISWRGDGMFGTLIRRHSSCLQQASDMVTFNPSSSVTVQDMGFDQLTDGSTFSNNAVTVNNSPAVSFSRVYIAHGQVVGLQLNACNNIRLSGNYIYQNWWFGVSVASTGTVGSPVTSVGFTSTGNNYVDQPIGLGMNFFTSDYVITGDAFVKSNLSLIQMQHAHGSVSGISVDGTHAYGLNTGTDADAKHGIFLEGVSDIDVGPAYIHNTTAKGIWCGGSSLTIGTTVQLPCNRVSIHDLHVDGVVNDWPVLINAASTDGTLGVQNSIKNTTVTNSYGCPNMGNVDGFEMSGNYCDASRNAGYFISSSKNGSFRSNRGHNIGTASAGSYEGLTINGTSSGIDVSNNEFVDEGSNTMHNCFLDSTLAGGAASTVRHMNNTCRGGNAWSPAPAVPALGTWNVGDRIESFSVGTDATQYWINTAGGSPGTWLSVGVSSFNGHSLFSGGVPVASSCGGAGLNVQSYSNDNAGDVLVGFGSVTSCTLTFSTPFTHQPSCTASINSNAITASVTPPTTTAVTFTFSSSLSSGRLFYHCF